MLIHKIVEFLVQAADNVILGNGSWLAIKLKHGGLGVLVEVPSKHDEYVLHCLSCNNLEPTTFAGLVYLLNVDTFSKIDISFFPIIIYL